MLTKLLKKLTKSGAATTYEQKDLDTRCFETYSETHEASVNFVHLCNNRRLLGSIGLRSQKMFIEGLINEAIKLKNNK
jgi:hypothetical protein